MKLSAALFALFAFPTFVTSIPLLNNINRVNDGYVNDIVTTKGLDEQKIDKRELSHEMYDLVNAVNVYVDEYNHPRGYSRSDFTKNVVSALHARNPHFNYIICHVDHDYNFGSPWGVNVYNVEVIYQDGNFFRTGRGYDVVIGKNGTFTRYGDGGYENWAYNGDAISTQDLASGNGVTVTFGIPA